MEENRPYIKKPLNAFMVFMREHRPFIDEEVKRKGNGVVNMHLAQTVGLGGPGWAWGQGQLF